MFNKNEAFVSISVDSVGEYLSVFTAYILFLTEIITRIIRKIAKSTLLAIQVEKTKSGVIIIKNMPKNKAKKTRVIQLLKKNRFVNSK